MVYRRIFFILMMLFATDAKSFIIGLPESALKSPYQQQVENSFNLLYSGIEAKISFAYLPVNRMMRMMQQQQLDAVAYQLNPQADGNLGMIRVPEPLTQFRLYVGCLEGNRCSIDKDLTFVVKVDSQYTQQVCEQLSLHCLKIRTPELAYKALKKGLVDVYLMQRSPHIIEPCHQEIGVKVYPVANTKINIYHFIKQSHHNIAQALAERLIKLKREFHESNAQECNDMLN